MSDDKKDKEILDSDADGLSDEEEKSIGTDPLDPDTDHDDLGDYQEVKVYKTNPLDPDTDHDHMSDGAEVKMRRNPKGSGALRNLLLPTEHNNYRPHILHPKRLVFHAASAVVIKIIVAAFILSFPVQAWLSPDILREQAQKVVQLTNQIRINLNLSPLTTNTSLQEAALAKSQDMIINEYFAHVGPDNRSLRDWLHDVGYNFTVAGENLAIGFSSADDVVAAWTNSPTHYANIIDPDFTEIGVGAVNGSYEGHETTLIAQYFGNRLNIAAEPVVPDEPAEIKPADYDSKIEEATLEPDEENQAIPEEMPELLPDREESEVLAEQAEPVNILSTPSLVLSDQEKISKENLNILHIYAPGASLIEILDSDQKLASQEKSPDSDLLDIPVELDNGPHHLQVVARYGNQTATSKVYLLTVDQSVPIIDQDRTTILVSQPVGQDDIVLKVTAYLSNDTNSAQVSFAGYNIDLEKDYSEENKWIGHQIISDVDYNDLFNPVVLASLTAADQAGNVLTQDISWQDITPVQKSVVGQYTFLRDNSSELIKPLFDLSSIYYKILLVILVIALLLNIFVEIKKQHPYTIASTIGLILLISFLTIF